MPSWSEPMSHRAASATLLGIWAVLTCLLAWPALVNGGPILFFDTMAYLNAGSAALDSVLGYDPGLFFRPEALAAAQGLDPAEVEGADLSPDTANASRSIYYALFLVGLVVTGGLWSVPLAQAALFAAALTAFLAAWLPDRPGAVLAVGVAATVLTGAPFFASYAMPDFLSGLMMLAVLRLVLPPALGLGGALAWAALLAFAVSAHMSHLLVGIGLFACAVVAVVVTRLPFAWRGTGLAALALLVGIAAELLFGYMVARNFGAPPLRPPFIAARMIEDGPGMAYLDAVCPPIPEVATRATPIAYDTPPPYELCRYRHRLPQDSLTVLWSTDPDIGVYGAADPASRDKLSAEHFAFALGVLGHAPLAQAGAAAMRFGEQMAGFSLTEFPYTFFMREKFDTRLSPPLRAEVQDTLFYRDSFPLRPADLASRAVTVLSAAALVVLFARPLTGPGGGSAAPPRRALQALAVLIVLALIGNAAVTGILSAPHDRYQARVYWLLPLVVGLLWAHHTSRSDGLAVGSSLGQTRRDGPATGAGSNTTGT